MQNPQLSSSIFGNFTDHIIPHSKVFKNKPQKSCQDPGTKVSIPSEFDWNKMGKVTPIRQQNTCGSCFIFAAVSVVESAILINGKNKLKPEQVDLSEQAILNCLPPNTCRVGGWPTEAWKVMKKRGIVDEKHSPYESRVSRIFFNLFIRLL